MMESKTAKFSSRAAEVGQAILSEITLKQKEMTLTNAEIFGSVAYLNAAMLLAFTGDDPTLFNDIAAAQHKLMHSVADVLRKAH